MPQFQIFAKPVGPICNLACSYCYYLNKKSLYPKDQQFFMPDDILGKYIAQHIEASTEPIINFSWHGGEPLLAGLQFYKKVVELQNKYKSSSQKVINGIQTNGILINDEWCDFLSKKNFIVGLSLDGPEELHNINRFSVNNASSFQRTFQAFKLLQEYNIICEILCVVNADNVKYPLEVYRFFKQLGVEYITFLPLVVPDPQSFSRVSKHSVASRNFGIFLNIIFDEWLEYDIGKVKIQIFEEAARTAFKQDHTLCIFKETCGGVPVVEHNGDFYSCDHYVDKDHYLGNITSIKLSELLDSNIQKEFGLEKLKKLPNFCISCEFRNMCNGGCPKNRILNTPDGEPELNYLCEGYKLFFSHCKPFIDSISKEWHQNK
jgi:uncharacterized protein